MILETMFDSTAPNTFGRAVFLVGQDDDTTGHLQKILAQIGSFCLVTIGIIVIAGVFVLYAGFRYRYRAGLDKVSTTSSFFSSVVLIPIAMPTMLSPSPSVLSN